MRASLLKSSRLFQSSGQFYYCCNLDSLLISKSSNSFTNLLGIVPNAPTIYSIIFKFSCKVLVFISLFAFFYFYSVVCWDGKVPYSACCLFCCWLPQGLEVWPNIGDLFVSQNPRDVCASHSPGQILSCAYTICSYGKISISGTIPRGLPSPHSCVLSIFALTSCFLLLFEKIKFPSFFPFFTMSKFSRVRFHLLSLEISI